MVLQFRAQAQQVIACPGSALGPENHTVRVPNAHTREEQFLPRGRDGLLDEFRDLERAGQRGRPKRGLSHLDGGRAGVSVAVDVERNLDQAAFGVY